MLNLGGQITHELPIVGGIGGIISATEVTQLAAMEGIDSLTEDVNPLKPPEARDCLVSGDLQVALMAQSLQWRVYNFGTEPKPLKWVIAAWPYALGDGNLSITPSLTNSPAIKPFKISSGIR